MTWSYSSSHCSIFNSKEVMSTQGFSRNSLYNILSVWQEAEKDWVESPARSILSISMSETFENDVLYRLCVDECMAGPLSALTAYTYIHTYIHTYKYRYKFIHTLKIPYKRNKQKLTSIADIHTYKHTYIQWIQTPTVNTDTYSTYSTSSYRSSGRKKSSSTTGIMYRSPLNFNICWYSVFTSFS